MKKYEQIPHTADMAAKVYGKSISEIFENAAFAMFDMMADLGGLRAEESVKIDVEAEDPESLLVSFLNEILYASFIKRMLFCRFEVLSLSDNKLSLEAQGEKFEGDNSRIHSEIKAATYHEIEIKKTNEGYETTIVFDV